MPRITAVEENVKHGLLGQGATQQPGRLRRTHTLQTPRMVNLYTKRSVGTGEIILTIRCHAIRAPALIAAVQLLRDAGLMSSNLTVRNQYVAALHRISTEVMQCAFGQEHTFRREQQMTLHRFPEYIGHQLKWLPWAFGSPDWRGGPGPDAAHQDMDCPGCPRCHMRLSG